MTEEQKEKVLPIHVLPYIAEKGSTVDNIPKWIHNKIFKPIEYERLEGLNYNSNELSNHGLFEKEVLPQLKNYLSDNQPDRVF